MVVGDTLDMARKGWAYPNLSYRETMTMLHEIKCPEILGKELDNCVVAWKEARKVQNMFIQTSANHDSPKYTSETEFFKHHLAVKHVNQHQHQHKHQHQHRHQHQHQHQHHHHHHHQHHHHHHHHHQHQHHHQHHHHHKYHHHH